MTGIVRYIMLGIIFVGIAGLAFILINDSRKNKNKKTETKPKNKKAKSKSNKKTKTTTGATQETLPFKSIEIYSEDNPTGLILKDDLITYVGILEVKGINYNLLDIAEREILEKSFEMLLNGIDYPIQLFIQSRRIDIENYKKKYESRLEEQRSDLTKLSDKIEYYKETDPENKEIEQLISKYKKVQSQLEYGEKIKEYIVQRCNQKNMLERRYYIAVSHIYNDSKFKEQLTEKEKLSNAFFDIENKASSLISALQRAKLSGKLLTGEEIAELLYISYNKADSEHYKFENALKSKFSHLYTTAEPVERKAMKRRLEDLQKEEVKLNQEIDELEEKVGA